MRPAKCLEGLSPGSLYILTASLASWAALASGANLATWAAVEANDLFTAALFSFLAPPTSACVDSLCHSTANTYLFAVWSTPFPRLLKVCRPMASAFRQAKAPVSNTRSFTQDSLACHCEAGISQLLAGVPRQIRGVP